MLAKLMKPPGDKKPSSVSRAAAGELKARRGLLSARELAAHRHAHPLLGAMRAAFPRNAGAAPPRAACPAARARPRLLVRAQRTGPSKMCSPSCGRRSGARKAEMARDLCGRACRSDDSRSPCPSQGLARYAPRFGSVSGAALFLMPDAELRGLLRATPNEYEASEQV